MCIYIYISLCTCIYMDNYLYVCRTVYIVCLPLRFWNDWSVSFYRTFSCRVAETLKSDVMIPPIACNVTRCYLINRYV